VGVIIVVHYSKRLLDLFLDHATLEPWQKMMSKMMTTHNKTEPLAAHIREIMTLLGEDPQRPALKKTPQRSAQALQFLTQGYHQTLEDLVNDAIFPSSVDELIVVRNIELYSLCEHHLLPFIGKCHVGYLPAGKVIGLSKVARIVDLFARRLQIQEHLTQQIAEALVAVTGAKGVGVIIEAQHLCMMMRGVEKQNSLLTTSVMRGTLRSDDRTRHEFLTLIKS
jgi:GTP cyclohydrolase I